MKKTHKHDPARNIFLRAAAQADADLLDAACETELMILDLQRYFEDVDAALAQAGSKTRARCGAPGAVPAESCLEGDVMLKASLSGAGIKRDYKFALDIRNRTVDMAWSRGGRRADEAQMFRYDEKGAMKKFLTQLVREALPAHAGGLRRPELT